MSGNEIDISIIIPVLNGEEYIETLISSVLSQKCSQVELIFADGGSTDRTIKIIENAKNYFPNNIVLELYPNTPEYSGCGRAWNKAVSIARGSIIGWLGSDDASVPGALSYVLQHFGKNAKCQVIYGHCEVINEHGKIIKVNKSTTVNFNTLAQGNNPISCPACFLSKKIFTEVGGVDDYGNDYDLFLKIAKKYPICAVDRVLGRFRIHSTSETGNINKYIRTLKLDADVLSLHTNKYFSKFRFRYFLAKLIKFIGLGRFLELYKYRLRG